MQEYYMNIIVKNHNKFGEILFIFTNTYYILKLIYKESFVKPDITKHQIERLNSDLNSKVEGTFWLYVRY